MADRGTPSLRARILLSFAALLAVLAALVALACHNQRCASTQVPDITFANLRST